jgi:hypothetical protein
MTGKVEESLNLSRAASHVHAREPFKCSVISIVSRMEIDVVAFAEQRDASSNRRTDRKLTRFFIGSPRAAALARGISLQQSDINEEQSPAGLGLAERTA